MTEDEIAGDDANYKMNPPLRSAADVEALVDGLADGTMEAISTDHAPHGEEEKKQSIAKAPFGIVGSETAYALSVTHLVKTGKLTPLQLVEKRVRIHAGFFRYQAEHFLWGHRRTLQLRIWIRNM